MIDKTEKKQGENYLSKVYSYERRPKSDYPEKLAKHLCEKYIKKEKGKLLDIGCGRETCLKLLKKINFLYLELTFQKNLLKCVIR